MKQLTLNSVSYQGEVSMFKYVVKEKLINFSYDFEFGKSYLLDAELGFGAWALAWIIGGKLKPQQGYIVIDEIVSSQADRFEQSWFIRITESERFRGRHRSLKWHIQQGLKRNKNQHIKTEDELISAFNLTLPRYTRKIRQFSNEGWRASCAVGMANGRNIFCFPSLHGVSHYVIKDFANLWLKDVIEVMKESGALVLIPAQLDEYSDGLCDEVIQILS